MIKKYISWYRGLSALTRTNIIFSVAVITALIDIRAFLVLGFATILWLIIQAFHEIP